MTLRNNTNRNWVVQNCMVVCIRNAQKVQLQLGAHWGKWERWRKTQGLSVTFRITVSSHEKINVIHCDILENYLYQRIGTFLCFKAWWDLAWKIVNISHHTLKNVFKLGHVQRRVTYDQSMESLSNAKWLKKWDDITLNTVRINADVEDNFWNRSE